MSNLPSTSLTLTRPSTSTPSCSPPEPAKVRPGYANFAIAEPPLKLVLIEHPDGRGHGTAGALNHLGVEVETPEQVQAATARLTGQGLEPRGARVDDLLLRRAGQGVGGRSRRSALGGVHGAVRRPRRDRVGLLDRVVPARTSQRERGGIGPFLLLKPGRPVTDSLAPAVGRMAGQRPAGRGGDRLGHRRPATLTGTDRPRTLRERGRHRRPACTPSS